jgi:tetratricopeptide (TPR) repeat protein
MPHVLIKKQKGLLALSQNDRRVAKEFFEHAISIDLDHPEATVALASIMLNIDAEDTNVDNKEVTDDDDSNAARDRALGLLEHLVTTARGWDYPHAWYILSQALEQADELERAKLALWKVVELEDTSALRGWSCAGSGVL